ncbi:hypothetical protein ABKV19_000764 [Rosa sericea]
MDMMDVRFKSITLTRIRGIALSYQALTSIDYTAIILNHVLCCLTYKLWILFVLIVFPVLEFKYLANDRSIHRLVLIILEHKTFLKALRHLRRLLLSPRALRSRIRLLLPPSAFRNIKRILPAPSARRRSIRLHLCLQNMSLHEICLFKICLIYLLFIFRKQSCIQGLIEKKGVSKNCDV